MIKLNYTEVKPTIFPDKTSQVWKLDPSMIGSDNLIDWDFENEAELIHIAQLKTLLDKMGKETSLQISYLPYGRQDKEVSNFSTFALTTFATLLNSLNFRKVYTLDAHSIEAETLINNLVNTFPSFEINRAFHSTNSDVICYPDKGAMKRYSENLDYPFVYGYKVRNQSTGEITDYKLNGSVKGKVVLICDDLCDAGATFIELSKKLLTKGAKCVNLYVTHGLFTKGTKVLRDAGINDIYTKNGEVK